MYRGLAAQCGLDEHGRSDLITKRRFPEALTTGVYFSLPRSGANNEEVSEALIEKFGLEIIEKTPGFTTFCKSCDGLGSIGASPCRACDGLGKRRPRFRSVRGDRHDYAAIALDEEGLAFWGYSRRLPFDPARDRNKYMLLSSSRADEASLAGLPKYHVAGRSHLTGRVFVTEGVIKAEITACRERCRVVGIYSTSVDEPTLGEVLRLARTWEDPCS